MTIENPDYGKTEDVEIAQAASRFGKNKVIVLQRGRSGYDGGADLSLTWGSSDGSKTSMTYPRGRQLDIGFMKIGEGEYDRGLIQFDLSPLKGKKIKKAWLKLTVRPNQLYYADELKGSFPVYPLLKPWKEGDKTPIWVDDRGGGVGFPNADHQAYPTKWEKRLASGGTDHGRQASMLEPETGVNLRAGAKADITGLVQDWLGGKLANHGMIIGKDLPDELAASLPHVGNKKAEYVKVCDQGLVPFFSSDEPDDKDFRPRMIVILE